MALGDFTHYPYHSRRSVVFGRWGMVATAEPHAAQVGLQVLREGGNAVDAAIAAAASLTVVEPTSNGLGSDAFAIVYHHKKLYGINASGPAPWGISRQWVMEQGFTSMPAIGWPTVTVPGAPAAWARLSERFGRLSLGACLAPSVRLAQDGFAVSPTVAHFWQRAFSRYQTLLKDDRAYAEWFRVFAPQGRAPYAGEVWHSADHARTLQAIGQSHARDFYEGSLAEKIERFSQATGGVLQGQDLAEFRVQWVEPIATQYRGYDVFELPPNGQGLVALMALSLLDRLPYGDEAEHLHHQIEAVKLAFADARRYLADPKAMTVDPGDFLDERYVKQRLALIGETASIPEAGRVRAGGTVYLATADGEGNMVSFIQSNFAGFGSGLVVPGTGIALQNRGALFSLEEGHPDVLEPGKRPYHTIIPGFLMKGGQAIGPFGVMGGFMQPQGHIQVLSRLLDEGLNPQAAIDAPRFYWVDQKHVMVESSMSSELVGALTRRGHQVSQTPDFAPFGRAAIIFRNPQGVLVGASEPRADGLVAAW